MNEFRSRTKALGVDLIKVQFVNEQFKNLVHNWG